MHVHVHGTTFEKRKQFSGMPTFGLKWESKTYKLKCSKMVVTIGKKKRLSPSPTPTPSLKG